MNAYRETDAHQRAKAAILDGCARARYESISEAIGDGWRADVMAVRGNVRIAFEVQWSFLKLHDTEARQERYARDGVRGCWFFRQPPGKLERADTLVARRDLPLFHMFANADKSFSVRLCGRLTPLDTFVASLLGGQVRFCEEAAVADSTPVTFSFHNLRCDNCGRTSHLHKIDSSLAAKCGTTLALPRDSSFIALRGEFLAAARQITSADPVLHLAQFKLDDGAPQAICPHCGSAISPRRMEMAGYGEQAVRTHDTTVTLKRPLMLKASHWCYPNGGDYCCTT